MTPTHAIKKGVRYRYYVSRRLITEVRARAISSDPASGAASAGGRTGASGRRAPQDLSSPIPTPSRSVCRRPPQCAEPQTRARAPRPTSSEPSQQDGEREPSICFDRSSSRAQVHPDRIDVDLGADQVADALLGSGRFDRDRLGDDWRHRKPIMRSRPRMTIDRHPARRSRPQLQRAGMEMKFILDGVDDKRAARRRARPPSDPRPCARQPPRNEPGLHSGRSRRAGRAWERPMRRD